ncbi:MAG: anti-sigma factor domain-containing protein [Candidatus Dormibacteria bacterium]
MKTCAEWEEDYLQALTTGTEPSKELLAHMNTCQHCHQLLQADKQIHHALREGVSIMPPPAALKNRVLASIHGSLPTVQLPNVPGEMLQVRSGHFRQRRSLLVVRLAVAAVLLLASGMSALNLARTSNVSNVDVAMQVPGQSATYGIVQVHPSSGIAYLANAVLPTPQAINGHASEYELWYIPNGGLPVPRGALAEGPYGQWHGIVSFPVQGNGLIAITVEPVPGTMKPTSLPIAAARV